MNKLSFASIACLMLSTACVVDADDDDQTTNASDNTVSDTNDTDQTSSPTTDPSTTTDAETTTSGAESSTGTPMTTSESETDTDPATTGETGGAACGWGMLGPDDDVEFGYLCGGEGADPRGMFEMECPVDLMVGGDCTEMMITAEGCCDADGDAWYCQDPDGAGPMEPAVVEEEC